MGSIRCNRIFNSAKVGLSDAMGSNKNLSNSNIYKFFNDPKYQAKWGWFLNYIKSVDGTINTTRQIDAIQGDGTNGELVLYHTSHLSHSIVNFFNKSSKQGSYTAIDFLNNPTKYNTVSTFNNKVYIDYSNYIFLKTGDEITIPEPPEKDGYTFTGYSGGVDSELGYVVAGNAKLTPQYTPIAYSITFYDGNDVIESLSTTYNTSTWKELPTYQKEGYTFSGWYDNVELEGSPVETIPQGSIGNKVYYAKTAVATVEPFSITYTLNDGHWKYATRLAMVNDFLDDFTAFYNKNVKTSLSRLTLLISGDPGYDPSTAYISRNSTANGNLGNFFNDILYKDKWMWMMHYIKVYAKAGPNDYNLIISNTHSAISSSVRWETRAFLAGEARGSVSVANYADNAIKNGFWSIYFAQSVYNYADAINTLPTPYKEGYTFGGWYDNASFSGEAITSVSSTKTLYAKWS